LAALLVGRPDVVGVDLPEDAAAGALVVRARNPRRFFEEFGRLVVSESLDVTRLEPLDESAHAVLGYLLGGSGKT
jgi:ABC-2 type transport system ATP-binding protein